MTPRISLELALQSLIAAQITDNVPVMTGQSSQDKPPVPGVTCRCECNGEEEPVHSGNYWMDAAVEFRMDAGTITGDPIVWERVMVRQVIDFVMRSDLWQQLNSQGQALTVFEGGVIFGAHTLTFDAQQGIWIDTMPLRIYCGGAVLPV